MTAPRYQLRSLLIGLGLAVVFVLAIAGGRKFIVEILPHLLFAPW